MRTVGRQAVCRDTGIPHYFDCREVVVVVAAAMVVVVVVMVVEVMMMVVVPAWMQFPGTRRGPSFSGRVVLLPSRHSLRTKCAIERFII
ncbi:hypothetical protein EAG_05704 [Camponotus floridanus]|uniref:Uncharacterized protein n=1 Tax=Camponotus floridanus TaxID=104421 RepID=E2AVM8_CAMFO|nr:hypothetical protein EAG_05704 [Camponotus floridanus]